MTKKAVIFDMDGVISDTQKGHSKAWSETLALYGINISLEEITLRYAGAKSSEVFNEVMKEYGLEKFVSDALREKNRRYALQSGKTVVAIKGVRVLINKLARDERALAVASGGGRENVEWVLSQLKLRDFFPVVVTADDVLRGKPSPDLFLQASKLLRRDPLDCVVIEDSRNGMLAAHLAGMRCVGLVANREDHDTYPADLLVESFSELSLQDF